MNHNIALARSASNEQVDSYSAGRDNVMQNTNASQAQFVQADATVLPDSNQAAANFAVQPSAEQRATVYSAEFKQRYSTNVRVTIRGGLTSPSRPLRIAIAWDGQGQSFDAEQVYDGTSTFIANHVYDPQGREKITVHPLLRVTDPAVLNADGTPFALVETLSLDVYPVYDITLSPLRSEEIHRGGWQDGVFGNCDFGSSGEGTLWWKISTPKVSSGGGVSVGQIISGHQYVSFSNIGPPYSAGEIQKFAGTFHYDTAYGEFFPAVIAFTENEKIKNPILGLNELLPSPLFPFIGDNGTNTKIVADTLLPRDTIDPSCKIYTEYDVTVTLDLNPDDNPTTPPPPVVVPPPVIVPPPAVTPPPPPQGGGGGGGPRTGPGTGRPPVQEQ
ncbi:hypothetical protein [Candidatus Nitrotoga sp. BS]|uniref:hypothetical protein n=1 Tax=Candidatus Nitrotoga sp. BS TaxID=2890408 RepID=UPI001EF25614|nr:hypothetical protein [Candidatus Nitrotoga sp. BS]